MRILIFGDIPGIPQSIRYIPQKNFIGIVAAAIRPNYIDAIKKIAEQLKVPFLVQPKWQSKDYSDFKSQIKDLNPDLLWVNSYSMIIRDDVVKLARLGGLNIHTALLPRNRGCNPIQWAIINGENETGVSLHMITSGLDEGPLISQKKIPILFEDSWLDVRVRLRAATERLIINNLPRILEGKWPLFPQDDSKATVGFRRTPQDSAFDWRESVKTIYDKIRALLPPLPPAYFVDCMGKKQEFPTQLTVWEVMLLKFNHLNKRYLEIDNISLRPLSRNDSQWLCKFLSLQKKSIIIDKSFPKCEEKVNFWITNEVSKKTRLLPFVIIDLTNNLRLGYCQFKCIDWVNRNAEIQIIKAQGVIDWETILKAALQLLCKFGFMELKLNCIKLKIYSDPKSHVKIIENCGFKRECILRKEAFIDGEWRDVIVMEKRKFYE